MTAINMQASQPMSTRDWSANKKMWERVLETRTGEGVAEWMQRIKRARLSNEGRLREWLGARGVTGYAQSLLVMERFGYPDFLLASADQLIDAQYADRSQLRAIFDAVVAAASRLGPMTLQARKTYVSLVGPRRTFARVQAATKTRVDVGLRLEGQRPVGRLRPSRLHETMRVQIGLGSPSEVDEELGLWLERAYCENR